MKILALSTSTSRGSVALVEDGRALAVAGYEDASGHAERVFAAIDEALAEAGLARGSIQAVACDVGPGSFTGVRVGVASAKGIALALGVPLAGVGSLEAMAHAAHAGAAVDAVCALIDAKKGEVFIAAYDRAGAVVLSPRHVAREAAAAIAVGIPGNVRVVGAVGAEIEGLAERVVRGTELDHPDAAVIGRMAEARRSFGDPASLEPLYVRAPDAKLPAA